MRNILLAAACLVQLMTVGETRGTDMLPLVSTVSQPIAEEAITPQPSEVPGDSWRYRWHGGTWWYWLPSERWVVWSNNQWTDYVSPQGGMTYQPYQTGYRGAVLPSAGFFYGWGFPHHHHHHQHYGHYHSFHSHGHHHHH